MIKKILIILNSLIIPIFLVLFILIPLSTYYVSTPEINACVLDYVDNLEESGYKWYMYDINWVSHIEPLNSNLIKSLKIYKIWNTNWCLMVSGNLFNDFNNTIYCAMTYLIRKSPIDDRVKEPLWLLEEK